MQHSGTGIAWQLHPHQACTAQHCECMLLAVHFLRVISTQDIVSSAAVQSAVECRHDAAREGALEDVVHV